MTRHFGHASLGCVLVVLLALFLLSCSEQADEAEPASGSAGPPDEAAVEAPVAAAPDIVEAPAATANGGGRPEIPVPSALDDYTVVLGADERIKMPGLPGELRVWIGHSEFRPDMPTGMVEDEATLPAVGEAAEVEPFAPAFEIAPEKTQCIKIHPSGSEVRFRLTPRRSGMFEVGANVYLFDSPDCSGAPIPRTAATLVVAVEVDRTETLIRGAWELWKIFWAKLLEFWAALVALVFALILFLIRDKLRRWFGFEQK